MQMIIENKVVELDKEGFLKKLEDWNKSVATSLAVRENITLTDAHWEIINLLRDFYEVFQISPSMRALIKRIEQILSKEKARSVYLLSLFPSTPLKSACKIAGLPKPENCV